MKWMIFICFVGDKSVEEFSKDISVKVSREASSGNPKLLRQILNFIVILVCLHLFFSEYFFCIFWRYDTLEMVS